MKAGRTTEAIEQYRRAIDVKPDFGEGYCHLGNALARAGRTAEAIENYQLAIRTVPDYADAYCSYGDLLVDLHRNPEALERYFQAVRLNPDDPATQNNLGEALLGPAALPRPSSIASGPRGSSPTIRRPSILGLCLAKAGRNTEAIAHLEESLRLVEAVGQEEAKATPRPDSATSGDEPPETGTRMVLPTTSLGRVSAAEYHWKIKPLPE